MTSQAFILIASTVIGIIGAVTAIATIANTGRLRLAVFVGACLLIGLLGATNNIN